MVESFTINGVTSDPDSGQGLIVTTAQSLELKASVSSSTYAIQSVTIGYAKRPATDFTALEPCTTTSCSRTWAVTQSDNGVYDFRVQAVDARGNSVKVNYPASVAIAIQ